VAPAPLRFCRAASCHQTEEKEGEGAG
jgi:hypothetical protein